MPVAEIAHPTEGLRERKKRATRRTIASAALRLAAEHGPDRVTVDAISEAADVSPRTFFNYFSTKDEAILGVDPDHVGELRARLEARPADEAPLEALRAALLETSVTLTEAAEEWALRMQLVRDHPSLFPLYVARFAALERVLAEAVAARLGLDADDDLYPGLIVSVAVTALRVAVNRWQQGSRTTSLTDLVDESFTHLARGLTAPAPR
jgi:AcrR family transcriptional regulator